MVGERAAMKILGIDGSPRKNGNTEKLVKAILQGAEANGAETRYYNDFSLSRVHGLQRERQLHS